MRDDQLKQIAEWCAENGIVHGSRLLGEVPFHVVETFALIDLLASMCADTEEMRRKIGTWFNDKQGEIERSRSTRMRKQS